MSKNAQQTQHFRIAPSRRIRNVFDVLHVCAALACWLNALQPFYRLILTVVVLVLWGLNRKRWKAAPIHLRYTGNSGWAVSSDGLNYLTAVVLETTVVTNTLIFLHFRVGEWLSRTLAIASDSLPENEFRRLAVRLKLCGLKQSG